MYPFKNLGLNRNRKIIAVANPSADITQMVAKAVPGVANNYRGVWDPSGTYTNGEMVLYSNVVWLCLASTTTATPATGSTVWQAIGSYSAFLGTWSSSTAYVVGDEVTYGGNFYFCTTANTNQTPNTSSSYWQIAGPSNLDNVADGLTHVRGLASEHTANAWDASKATNANSKTQYTSAVTGSQSNYIPDSELRYGLVFMANNSGTTWSVSPTPGEGCNGLLATGTGSAWGTSYRYTIPFYLAAGTYTLSVSCNGSANITAGFIFAGIYAFTKGTGLGAQETTVNFGVGHNADGRFAATFTIASGGYFVYLVDTYTATATSGGDVYVFKPQLEAGLVMTAYRGQFDATGYSVLAGSGPQNVADLYFNWTSTTTTIQLTPTNNEWYQADGTLAAFSNGTFFPGPNTESGFAASTSGKVYPYVDLQNNLMVYVNGGAGSPDFIVQTTAAEQLSAVQLQNMAYRVPLSSGGISVSTPASGSGGGSGGGNKCLHAEQRIPTQNGEKAAADLCVGDLVLTPSGYQPVRKVYREPCSIWVIVTTDTGDTLTVTPKHCLYDAEGEIVRVDTLHLGQLLQGADGGLRAVQKLEWHEEPSMLVRIEVADPKHQFIAAGLVHRNGTVKP